MWIATNSESSNLWTQAAPCSITSCYCKVFTYECQPNILLDHEGIYILYINLWIHTCQVTYLMKHFVCLASYVKGYPLDLSILISGGKETKRDSPSNGERRGNSPSLNRVSFGWCEMWGEGWFPESGMDQIVLRQHVPLGLQYKVIALFIVHSCMTPFSIAKPSYE